MAMVNSETGIPRVITIFSAPNYCDVCVYVCVCVFVYVCVCVVNYYKS